MEYMAGSSSLILLLKFIILLNLAEYTCYMTHKFVADTKSCTKHFSEMIDHHWDKLMGLTVYIIPLWLVTYCTPSKIPGPEKFTYYLVWQTKKISDTAQHLEVTWDPSWKDWYTLIEQSGIYFNRQVTYILIENACNMYWTI